MNKHQKIRATLIERGLLRPGPVKPKQQGKPVAQRMRDDRPINNRKEKS